jgi:UMF1 family MFS transporter
MEEKKHKRAILAWTMYDWGNSAFATTIMAAVLPVYYSTIATAVGVPDNLATAYWGYTTAFAALIAAIISPILGTLADLTGLQALRCCISLEPAIIFWLRFSSFSGTSVLLAVLFFMIPCFPMSLARTKLTACLPVVMPWVTSGEVCSWQSMLP